MQIFSLFKILYKLLGTIKNVIRVFIKTIIGVNRWIIFLLKFIESNKDNVINDFEFAPPTNFK
jgi:hypothetical protein